MNAAHPVWRVEMLGTLQAKADRLLVTRFRTRRVGLLLAYLALTRNRMHHREEVAELLWPDQDPEATARNLRQALFTLRRALEPPTLGVEGILMARQSTLQMNSELVTTDVSEFEALVARASSQSEPHEQIEALKTAVTLYKGELLPGFYEDWIQSERLRLEDLYLYAIRRLIELCEAEKLDEESILYLRLALAKEPLNEEWHVRLMEKYLVTSRPSSALNQYRELKQYLAEQLSCEPSVEAKRLGQRAKAALGVRGAVSSAASQGGTDQRNPVNQEEAETSHTPALYSIVEQDSAQLSRLPSPLTQFYGREPEIERALDLIQNTGARLVSIVGPAGVGKTRLSIEVGRLLSEQLGWDVWFNPLADLASAEMLADSILDTFKAGNLGREDLFEAVGSVLKGSKNLVILDNLEHIVEQATPFVADLVRRVPHLQVLVTTRQALKIDGEWEIGLGPLPVPTHGLDWAEETSADLLTDQLRNPCIQLFVDRCQRVRPDFQLTRKNAAPIARICLQMEGLPLALEIAAATSNSFAPAQMVQHLQNRLTALTSRRRDISERHRSLRAAIDYSYELLRPDLRRLFTALSVFRGGFSIESAFEVSYRWAHNLAQENQDLKNPHDACMAAVIELQDRSLVGAETGREDAELRFRMLEAFREYGEDRLSAEEYRELREQHANYFLNRKEFPDHGLSRTAMQIAVRTAADYDNYIAAIGFYLQKREIHKCIDLLDTLQANWYSGGPKMIERAYIRQISDLPESKALDPDYRILLLRMLGTTYIRSSEFDAAYRACNQALEVAKAMKSERQIAICRSGISVCAGFLGRQQECLDLNLLVLPYAKVAEDYQLLEKTYLSIGAIYWGMGELDLAEQALLSAKSASANSLDGEPSPLVLYNLARVYLDTGRLDEAMVLIGDAIRISKRLHDDFNLALALTLISRYQWLKGNLSAALASNHEAMVKRRECAFSYYTLYGIQLHSLLLSEVCEFEAATILLGATHSLGRTDQSPDEKDRISALETVRSALRPEAFERAWAKGLAMNADEAYTFAIQYK
ncbi:MAG TPA: BTAD domain-containing putative transcriptional regulator [Fimbriimonadaceae bacterium]